MFGWTVSTCRDWSPPLFRASPARSSWPSMERVCMPGTSTLRTLPGSRCCNLASSAGYLAWAPDRPGVGASAELSERKLSLTDQAEIMLEAIDTFRRANGVEGRVLLVGHSYGLKLGWTMAALDTTDRLLGVDGSGAGLNYAFDWHERQTQGGGRPRLSARVEVWGPDDLYPPSTRRRDLLPATTEDRPSKTARAQPGRPISARWPTGFGCRCGSPSGTTTASG